MVGAPRISTVAGELSTRLNPVGLPRAVYVVTASPQGVTLVGPTLAAHVVYQRLSGMIGAEPTTARFDRHLVSETPLNSSRRRTCVAAASRGLIRRQHRLREVRDHRNDVFPAVPRSGQGIIRLETRQGAERIGNKVVSPPTLRVSPGQR